MFNVNRNTAWLTSHGFKEMTDEELDEYKSATVIPAKKYSTLKIIRTLGDEWETYRTMLSEAGVLDQFFAANYLSEDDPVFVSFMQNVPEELKSKLDQCIWEA